MMKRLLIMGFALASLTSNAAYLNWQVTSADTTKIKSDYECVRLIYKSTDGKSGELAIRTKEGAAGGEISTDLSTLQSGVSYSLFVELVNYNTSTKSWDQVGITTADTALSYSATATSGAGIDIGNSAITPTAWHGGTIDVPEPTSGMMVMMGFAFLALRRRKA